MEYNDCSKSNSRKPLHHRHREYAAGGRNHSEIALTRDLSTISITVGHRILNVDVTDALDADAWQHLLLVHERKRRGSLAQSMQRRMGFGSVSTDGSTTAARDGGGGEITLFLNGKQCGECDNPTVQGFDVPFCRCKLGSGTGRLAASPVCNIGRSVFSRWCLGPILLTFEKEHDHAIAMLARGRLTCTAPLL